ncbi:hypothetical protein [Rhizobium sp. SSA_523]|uniref:hypothetical protein n=1 Tax=Rhizobium sp. SSA_523 TaxID=2952477 RepID=UPI00209011D4|nr:hypothetical protein [Rhizobium sp. SSA_523]MCO5733947.1 hypothetical protein [Rhizobium sp. SSA_523]WKC24793.1 hypothetical protein QTJ18_12275 [Rhizobium sp. SSA_523]
MIRPQGTWTSDAFDRRAVIHDLDQKTGRMANTIVSKPRIEKATVAKSAPPRSLTSRSLSRLAIFAAAGIILIYWRHTGGW